MQINICRGRDDVIKFVGVKSDPGTITNLLQEEL